MGDRLLVKVQDAETQTTGGILLPESSQQRPTSGSVVALGDGKRPGDNKHIDFTVKVGEEVRSCS
jgi:chaperonin GroES